MSADRYRCTDAVQEHLDGAEIIGDAAIKSLSRGDHQSVVQAILSLSEVVRALVVVQHMALEVAEYNSGVAR